MKVTFWGTRGSLATPDPETVRFGGNTSCVEVRAPDDTLLILDAGTGIRRLGRSLSPPPKRMDILLSHLHMDHIQGLGFFGPLFQPGIEVHLWGPGTVEQSLEQRLARYLSPPLFPVHLRAVASDLRLHELSDRNIDIGPFRVQFDYACHPNPTVGYRITDGRSSVTYLPDHEPALGMISLASPPEWTSGYPLSVGVDLLIHDAQYDDDEYAAHVGWGHSSMTHACTFAELCGVHTLAPFHHDPSHTDLDIDRMVSLASRDMEGRVSVVPAREGMTLQLDNWEQGVRDRR